MARLPLRCSPLWRAALVVAVAALAAGHAPADAHSPDRIYAMSRPQAPGWVRTWYSAPSVPPEWLPVLYRAADQWNLAEAGYFKFGYNGEAGPYTPWGNCSHSATDPWDRGKTNGVHFEALPGPAAPDYYAIALMCNANPDADIDEETTHQWVHPGETFVSFNIVFDPSENWRVTLAGGAGVPGQSDAWGIAAHEFGHATGFIDHWDLYDRSLCADNREFHTMCDEDENDPNTWWVRRRSLEFHDQETFRQKYPPPSGGGGRCATSMAAMPVPNLGDGMVAWHCHLVPRGFV